MGYQLDRLKKNLISKQARLISYQPGLNEILVGFSSAGTQSFHWLLCARSPADLVSIKGLQPREPVFPMDPAWFVTIGSDIVQRLVSTVPDY